MSAASLEVSQRSEDVGSILAKVQDDIQHLRAAAARAGEGELDLQALDAAIARTEKRIQAAAERVLSAKNNQVTTLPAVGPVRRRTKSEEPTLRDLAHSRGRTSPIKQARALGRSHPPPPTISPGQQAQLEHVTRLLSRPTHPVARHVLTQQYGLPSPSPTTAPKPKDWVNVGQLATGTTVSPLTTLPRAHRRDAQLPAPPICQSDTQRGLLSLLERGLIPPAAHLVLRPPPVQPRAVQLHSPSHQFVRQKVADGGEVSTSLAGVKLDSSPPAPPPPRHQPISIPTVDRSRTSIQAKQSRMSTQLLEPPTVVTPHIPKVPPASAVGTSRMAYQLVIQDGRVMEEYGEFQEATQSNWDNVHAVLGLLEELCRNYAIPLALVDGHRVVELAAEHELGLRLGRPDLLETVLNAREVCQLLALPGRRYKGHRGVHAAATAIQATYRMFVKRREYLEHRRRKWATGIISMSWLLFVKLLGVKKQLRQTRADQLERHRERAKVFRRRWEQIKTSRRVVVHLPSLGHAPHVRANMEPFRVMQNLQLSRICDVSDPNVEVLYISPVPVREEVREYYSRLLTMVPGGGTAMDRVHFITPEKANCKAFARRNMALSSILAYSPRALQSIRSLTAGKEAYIVPGVVTRDDIAVADKLGLPMLGPEPDISKLYATKSGAKRIFNDAQVGVPPSEGDIFSEEQLVDRLASLVTGHPLVPRWLFKLPEHVHGRGFAYCDVPSHLDCHAWVLKESQRYGEKWTKKWAQEYALKRVLSELPSILSKHATPVDTHLFPTWREFLTVFLNEGGVIEGCPPSDSVTPLSVDILIEPNGSISLLSMQDQICSAPYHVWGVSVPQTSVPTPQLVGVAQRVATACRARGIIGHLSVDLITFIHPKTLQQELWAVDLDIGHGDHLSQLHLLTYVTRAHIDWEAGRLLLPQDSGGTREHTKKEKEKEEEEGEERFAVMSPHLLHTNLSVLHYPVFFQMCKAHHIGYDPQERVGTLFALVDGHLREYLGMICLQPTLPGAIRSFSSNLSTIHQEISTPLMQGHSNFQAATEELDTIAELVQSNQSDEESSS